VQYAPLEASRYDAAFSRFGVMFFADPVAAFANVLRALKPTGRLSFVCWRPLSENPWMHVPLEAARSLLPPASPSDPTAPGPFAFANPDRVRSILTAAGFSRIAIDPFDTPIGGADLAQTVDLALRIGPLGATLREQPDLLPSVVGAVSEARTSMP
jgi:SAM-dependent methyltransferase